MNKSKLIQQIRKLEELSSRNNDACLDAGLGLETYSESRRSTNPLSIERCRLADQLNALRNKLADIGGKHA